MPESIRSAKVGLFLSAVLLLASACGGTDSKDNDSSGNPSSSADLGKAQAALGAVESEPQADDIAIKTPLTKAPERKTIAWLACTLPICQSFTQGLEAATTTLGWKLNTISVDLAAPAAGFQQALDSKPNYIAMIGIPLAAIEQQMAAAKNASIPVLSCAGGDDPTGASGNGLYLQCLDAEGSAGSIMTGLSSWPVIDSQGSAKILSVTSKDIPALIPQEAAARKAVDDFCPSCSFKTLQVTVGDLGSGAIPQKVVSYLQANPDIKYVQVGFSDMVGGLPEALEAAGMADRVKIFGANPDKAALQGIADGTQAAWLMQPNEYSGWLIADAAARLATSTEIGDEQLAASNNVPGFIVSNADSAKKYLASPWAGPAGYEEHFADLWLVGKS